MIIDKGALSMSSCLNKVNKGDYVKWKVAVQTVVESPQKHYAQAQAAPMQYKSWFL